ncbi:MAG: GntR family transcriptional regulator [Cereibacter sphaeroides]|uniref:GntR family transcriptional regulator n=1 Tax=Cereibacter sphaeroides TaxID=1063 RepID=A0A2W5TIW3_CERSP|nr:MAG: GntR family transcriptional regulator [Cereibacter sphaeroides]
MSIPPEAFVLPQQGGTLQERIRALIVERIAAGRFRAGERLPSSRGLARQLGVARITVTLAYTELLAGDYLTSRGRSGYFVSDSAPVRPALPFPPATPPAVDYAALTGRRFSRAVAVTKPADWRSYPFPFIYGQADASLFDHQNWRACAMRALGKRDFEALSDDWQERDDPLLIEYILRGILPRRGISARPEEVLITMGAQNGLWLAATVLLGQGGRAVVENPVYPGLRAILQQGMAKVLPVDVDAEGLPPERLPADVDVVFAAPSHHSPTNATMPLARRMALLQAAARQNFVVVEDDYEFEMSFLAPASPSLKSLDHEGRVIHAGSFSKSIFPGLRLGYLVGPESFIAEARALRVAVLRHPPGNVQRTAAYFLSLGHYDALVARMKQTFRRRRVAMEEAIAASGLEVVQAGGFGGSSFWMRAPEGVDTEALALRLRARGVLIEPGRAFFDGEGPRSYYRLAYSSIAAGRIAEGIGIVAEEIG